jgi:hypothetical protein
MESIGAKYEPLVPLHNAEILPGTPADNKMFYRNDSEDSLCIGYLRGDFGKNGADFNNDWFDGDKNRHTPEFKTEFQEVINTLRQTVLKDLKTARDYCYKYPEARLPGDIPRYGFKVETETRQYFIRCTTLRDDYFYIFAHDKSAPVQEAVKYTLGELIEKMEPQARRDKLLINDCVEGLGLYAAQLARADADSPIITEMRDLAEQLVHYWGLNDDYLMTNAKPLDEYMQAFNDKIEAVKFGYEIAGDVQQSAQSVIYGLYRYGEDMVGSQGEIAMSEIMRMSGLIKEIGAAWDFDSDILNNLTARLEFEVRDMLENYPLPGNPVSGVSITDCKVTWAAVFDDAKIIALANNTDATFSVWEINDLKPDFDSRRNFATEESAKIDFIERVITHQNLNYGVKLKTPSVDSAKTARGKSNSDTVGKQSVIEEIRAAQKTQKEQPQTSKPELGKTKKKNQPDI